jgi:hypothetical protein
VQKLEFLRDGMMELSRLKKQQKAYIEDQRAALLERCRTFTGFVKEAWHVPEPSASYLHNWHVDAIGEHLEAAHRGEITRLMINQPPGTMKSLSVSVLFPAWEWGPKLKPGLRYFTTSYEAGYARRDSRKHRDLVQSEWFKTYWPHVVLTSFAEEEFENTYKGGRKAVPISRLTAGRGNRLLIDDPHSTEQAESLAEKETTTRIFKESAQSRLNDPMKDLMVLMMHRLAPDDLCGVADEIEAQGGDKWVRLVLPMEFSRSLVVATPYYEDPRREENELLFPARWDRQKCDALKIASDFAWDTQYNQRAKARKGSYYFAEEKFLVGTPTNELVPGPLGDLIPRVDYRPAEWPATCDAVFAVSDTASKTEKKHDGTGVSYYAYTKFPQPGLVLLEWAYEKISADMLTTWMPGILRRGEELARAVRARSGWTFCFVEDKDSGVALIQHATRMRWRVKAVPSELTALGKDGRALSVSGYINRGLLKVSRPAFEQTCAFNGRVRNHWFYQATHYRMKMSTPEDEDELFDCCCYGASLAFGDKKGF